MALFARRTSELPIVMNYRVLRQLNVLLGTPDGRAYLRASLARMEQFGPSISEQIKRYGLPPELIAVPMAESGYRNLPAGTNPRQGAGLWMFIESTARRFGLEITETTDERLNIPDETEAALRLLSDLHGRFNDWHLALLAYNTGQTRVEQAIRETGSRDAWQLARPPYENDRDYLARVMAMMVIIKNPGA
jgi:soluble lytic murein transglycosylase-like protein